MSLEGTPILEYSPGMRGRIRVGQDRLTWGVQAGQRRSRVAATAAAAVPVAGWSW